MKALNEKNPKRVLQAGEAWLSVAGLCSNASLDQERRLTQPWRNLPRLRRIVI